MTRPTETGRLSGRDRNERYPTHQPLRNRPATALKRAARALLPQSNARTRSTITESHKEPTVRTKPRRAHMTVNEFCDRWA